MSFFQACKKLSDIKFLNSLENQACKAATLLCLTELCLSLGPLSVPLLPPFIKWMLELMSDPAAIVKVIFSRSRVLCHFVFSLPLFFVQEVENVFLSAAESQRPRNYLSCCCSWIFCLIYALSTSTTLTPPSFFSLSLLAPLSLTPHSLSLSLPPHTLSSLSLTPLLLTAPPLSFSPPPLSHSSLSIHSSLTYSSLSLSPYLCLFTYAFSPMFILPASTFLLMSIYLPTSTYLYQHTYHVYLPLDVNLPSSTYLYQHTHLLMSIDQQMPTYHHLLTYVKIPTYLCLPTNLCQPTIIYLSTSSHP